MSYEQVYSAIETAIQEQAALAALSSPSATAEYKLWMGIYAHLQDVFMQIIEADKVEFSALLERSRGVGTPPWFAQRALEFQWNKDVQYELIVDGDGFIHYDTTMEADRVVKQAAAFVRDATLYLKVATLSNGSLAPLTAVQLFDLQNYINNLALPGMNITATSMEGDKLTIAARLYYDKAFNANILKDNAAVALDAYNAKIKFDGLIYRNEVIAALKGVSGVVDVDITTLRMAAADGSTTDVERVYETTAGYFTIESVAFELIAS